MIFPDWGTAEAQSESGDLPLYTEWAMDWDAGAFAARNGLPYTVTGDEALRIWVRCALHPENQRFLYSAHSEAYGNQLATYMTGRSDQGILENLLRRELRETLLVSPYITDCQVRDVTFDGSTLHMEVEFTTIYGKEGFHV